MRSPTRTRGHSSEWRSGGHLSAAFTDDGFRQRLALDTDRLIVRVVIVDVEGWIRQPGDEAARDHLPVKLVDCHHRGAGRGVTLSHGMNCRRSPFRQAGQGVLDDLGGDLHWAKARARNNGLGLTNPRHHDKLG